MKLTGQYFSNIYEYEFAPNTYLGNSANLTHQATRSFTGQQVLIIDSLPEAIFEITKLYVDSENDGSFGTILDTNDLFIYYSLNDADNRTLFIQFDDSFMEHNVYDVKIEYLYSTNQIDGPSFILDLDVYNLVSDLYTVQFTAYDIHNNIVTKTYTGVNIDHSGPVISPQFTNGAYLNHTSGSVSFEILDPSNVDSVSLEINDGGWRDFNGQVSISGNIWTFNFNEPSLNSTQNIRIKANDSLGYTSQLYNYDIFFDNTELGFFPETLPNGYLFNGSGLMVIQNTAGLLFNKSVKSLHLYANSEYTDLGYYLNLPLTFNDLIIDSMRIPDGLHNITFEFIDIADNTIKYTFLIKIDNSPPTFEEILLYNKELDDEIYFNEDVSLKLDIDDISNIQSVDIHVLKVLGDPAIYRSESGSKVWSSLQIKRIASNPIYTNYLSPNNLTYSFYDNWWNGTDFIYENALWWGAQQIPFIDLNIYDIEEAVSSNGESIPFFFDNYRQEITFDERYRNYLTENITLNGVKCDIAWNSSFTLNGGYWELENYNIEDYLNSPPQSWWTALFGFDNDDSQYNLHYDYPRKYTRTQFEFFLQTEDEFGNSIKSQVYEANFDNIIAKGSFGQIVGDSSSGSNYWLLGKTATAGNLMFGTSNPEHRTLYFTPGYVYNSSSNSYYVDNGFLFLHNIERIKLFNASNFYLGDMVYNPTTLPHPTYTFELNSKDISDGFSFVKAEVWDKANHNYTTLQTVFVVKEGSNDLENTLNFGDVVYYNRDQNYTLNPIQFTGLLDNWNIHENKSDITVDMSYWDYVEQIWLPMGTTTTSDGTFTIDWNVDNNTFYKLLPYQRSYLPINYTFNKQPNSNYFYGSYGYFDDSGILHPFLVNAGGDIYVYSFNNSNRQWFINFTISLGFSVLDKVLGNFDLNKDNLTDLIVFNQLSTSDNISIYIYDSSSNSYNFNQTILATDISLPVALPNSEIKDYLLDFASDEFFSMYISVSNSSNDINYIAKLDFDNYLSMTQDNDGTQLPALKVVSSLHIMGENIYIGFLNPSANGIINSSLFSIDKQLALTFTTFENEIQGAIMEINSFTSQIGEVLVVGISMIDYNQDDIVLYYIFDVSTETWYKTEFNINDESSPFTNEIYDFRIRQLVKSKEDYYESVLIASSQGLWRTTITTNIIT
ncbi:hypothetical protein LCGC14_1075340, partial [marine sediment metagenome]